VNASIFTSRISGVARVRLEKKTGAKAIEIIAIIAVGSIVKTSLTPARDSDDKSSCPRLRTLRPPLTQRQGLQHHFSDPYVDRFLCQGFAVVSHLLVEEKLHTRGRDQKLSSGTSPFVTAIETNFIERGKRIKAEAKGELVTAQALPFTFVMFEQASC
jgi:hypothetical protein